MAIEATFTTSEDEFPLAAIFSELPDAQIELDRVVPTNKAIIPYFWIGGADVSEIDITEIDHPGIETIQIVEQIDTQAFLRTEWNFDYESILTAILKTEIELLSAVGKKAKWTFELRATTQETISEFQSYCQENDIPVELTQLHALSSMQPGREYDLTDAQREALVRAYNRGYYDSPRKTTQQEIADEIGITPQALGSRLRRGIRRLIASTLISPE